MAITATPNSVSVYPASTSNPVGNASATVTLSGDTTYSVSNPATSVVTAAIVGSTLTVTYVSPNPTAGAPVTLTITGSPSGATTTVAAYSYGALTLTSFSPSGSVSGSFTVVEAGYAGTFTATIDPPLGTLSASSANGPSWGPITISPVSPGECVITIIDDHGSAVQFLTTIYTGSAVQNRPQPLGYPSAGVWFDFLHPDADGLPTVGEIRGMAVTGATPLRGPADNGNFAWCSGIGDSISQFAVGYGDNGVPITMTFAGKSDFFGEELGQGAPVCPKTVDNVCLLISIPIVAQGEQLTFSNLVIADNYASLQSFGETAQLVYFNNNAVVGTAIVGSSIIGGGSGSSQYQVTRAFSPQGAFGRVIQVEFQESSIYGYDILGYVLRLSAQEETSP